jgi:hypothetical protein
MMNFLASIGSISLSFLLLGGESQAETKLLPGVQYCGGSEKLKGRLVFEVTDKYVPGKRDWQCTIYEFDLQHEKLRKLTRAPAGIFIASEDGNVFCILVEGRRIGTNAFSIPARHRKAPPANYPRYPDKQFSLATMPSLSSKALEKKAFSNTTWVVT